MFRRDVVNERSQRTTTLKDYLATYPKRVRCEVSEGSTSRSMIESL